MSLSQERAPAPAPMTEAAVCPDAPSRALTNPRAAEFPVAAGDGALAAALVLGADPLALHFYEPLVTDPVANLRDVLFTCYLHSWSGFNDTLRLVDEAARAELGASGAALHPARAALLLGLRDGLVAGKSAFRDDPSPWELDVLLGLLDPVTAPLTASFIDSAYAGSVESLAAKLLDRAEGSGDAALVQRAALLPALLGDSSCSEDPRELAQGEQTPWLNGLIRSAVGRHAELVDGLAAAAAPVPALGPAVRGWAGFAKLQTRYAGGALTGAAELAGGLANMALHPKDTAIGALNLLERLPGSPLQPLHKLTDVATGAARPQDAFNPRNAPGALAEDLRALLELPLAVAAPIVADLRAGRIAEAAGRASFEGASMWVGWGELKGALKGARRGGGLGEEIPGRAPDAPKKMEASDAKSELSSATKTPHSFDPLTASEDQLWKKATSRDPDAAAARIELKLRDGVAGMTDAQLARVAAGEHAAPRMVELAQREIAIRQGALDAYARMAKDGTLQRHIGAFPAPNAETIAAARQVFGLMSDAGLSRRDGIAVQVAQRADGGFTVAISGEARKVAGIRARIQLPPGLRWADDQVPFLRDDRVLTPSGERFDGGLHCAEPKTFLSGGEPPVLSQVTTWYGQEAKNPWSAMDSGDNPANLMHPCPSCGQHAERLVNNPRSVRNP